jgi:hypothetical protein
MREAWPIFVPEVPTRVLADSFARDEATRGDERLHPWTALHIVALIVSHESQDGADPAARLMA